MSGGGFYHADFQTDCWKRTAAHLERLLAADRATLESQALDEKPTSATRLRARIGLLKELLALPTHQQDADPDD